MVLCCSSRSAISSSRYAFSPTSPARVAWSLRVFAVQGAQAVVAVLLRLVRLLHAPALVGRVVRGLLLKPRDQALNQALDLVEGRATTGPLAEALDGGGQGGELLGA